MPSTTDVARVILLVTTLATVVTAVVHVEVNTTLGRVRGIQRTDNGKNVDVFLGVPYAQPPVGELRFRRPQPLTAWPSTGIDALTLPNSCQQEYGDVTFESMRFMTANTELSEDCLYLNIWAPSDRRTSQARGRAVMVFIHGGGFYAGSSTQPRFNGTTLAAVGDVIYVSMQYRLGPLGFLYLGTDDALGNAALLDQQMAIQWVKSNIGAFGGDPNRITLFGVSAGAVSVDLQLLTPLNENIVHQGISQGGSAGASWAVEQPSQALGKATTLAKLAGCKVDTPRPNPASLARCLRAVDSARLVSLASNSSIRFRPIVDGYFLPANTTELLRSERLKNLKVMIGSNMNEGTMFTALQLPYLYPENATLSKEGFETFLLKTYQTQPAIAWTASFEYSQPLIHADRTPDYRDLLSDILADSNLVCPSIDFATVHATRSRKVYMYQFTHRTSANPMPKWTGVMHVFEVDHVFGAPLSSNSLHQYSNEEKILSRQMVTYWTNFAKTGDPNIGDDGSGGQQVLTVTWPEFTVDERKYIVLNVSRLHVAQYQRERKCAFWLTLAPQLKDVCSPSASSAANIIQQSFNYRTLVLMLVLTFSDVMQ